LTAAGTNLSEHFEVVDRRVRATYELYRDSLLNKKYYADRLETAKRWSLVLEFALVFGTSGAIATWAAWKTPAGARAWAMITAASTVLAILKPLLQFPNKIERYTGLYTGHAGLYYDLKQLVDDIQDKHDFTDPMWATVQHTQERVKELGLKNDPRPVRRLQRKYFKEVVDEIPADKLWFCSPAQLSGVAQGSLG
jgi:hypothetical protein